MVGRWIRVAAAVVLASAAAACGDDVAVDESEAVPAEPGATADTEPTRSAEIPAASAPDSNASTLIPATTTAVTEATSAVPTPEDLLAELTDDQIASLGGRECALEAATLAAAFQQFTNDRGVEPQTFADLFEAGYLEPLELWDIVGFELQPKPGSGCIDPQASATCVDAAAALAVARIAYLQQRPDASEPTQAELALAGLIDEPNPGIELIAGDVVAVPGGPCDDIGLTVDWQQMCDSDYRTMQVAREAFYAKNGSYPASEADLVTAGMIRRESALFDLVGADVVAVAGAPCEGVDLS